MRMRDYMELTKLALIKTVMPCVKLEIAEQALQNESNPREQLHQKINIQGGVEDEEEPSTVKVRIKISVSTDSGNVAFEVCRESTFQNESGEKWKNREDAMQDVKNTAIPLAYEDMQRFVEELSKSAGISPFPIPGYDTIQKDESE